MTSMKGVQLSSPGQYRLRTDLTVPEPKPGEKRSDAPGEGVEGLELSPEKAQRLLDRAKKLDEQLKKAKARRTTRRRAVERDW